MDTNSKNMQVPSHIAVIMDGNGRWALRHGFDRSKGHEMGMWKLRDFVNYCANMNIRIVTAYTLSTENWSRPPREINGLMSLLRNHAPQFVDELREKGVKIQHLGERQGIPSDVLKIIDYAISTTKTNEKYILNLAFNYGGRQEIIAATKRILKAGLKPEQVNEDVLRKFMYEENMPDPELIIRSGGEHRISNFLLWQTAHSVFYVTKTEWPDFSQTDFDDAIRTFSDFIEQEKSHAPTE